jgi:16S rRNA (uracil1498-N3)-methyltransferase
MRRFYVEEIRETLGALNITGQEARHITRVLRMGQGDRFIIMDSRGRRFLATILEADSWDVLVTLEKSLPQPPAPPVEIILCQALSKSGPMDYAIQKASELGVHSIQLFTCERSVVRAKRERLSNRMRHWREIALAAAKQSDRDSPAQIEEPVPLEDLLLKWEGKRAVKALLWEQEDTMDLKGLLRETGAEKRFVAIVGPEGGFSKGEAEAAVNAGFVSVSLGTRILRSETAALALVGIVQYEWGDLGLSTGS